MRNNDFLTETKKLGKLNEELPYKNMLKKVISREENISSKLQPT